MAKRRILLSSDLANENIIFVSIKTGLVSPQNEKGPAA
jgi:hypothetical protein